MEMGGSAFEVSLWRGVRPVGNDIRSVDRGVCKDGIRVGSGELELGCDEREVGV